jgi:hypothetical protein
LVVAHEKDNDMDAAKLAELKQQADTLSAYWKLIVNDFPPSYKQWFIWLGRYTPEVVEKGIAAMALREERGHLSGSKKLRYASACMRNIRDGVAAPKKVVSHA